jgi:predicted HicB family RNase H-like nuclease
MAVSDKNIRIQVTIPKNIKKQLVKKAEKHNRSLSNYVANLIIKDLKEEN